MAAMSGRSQGGRITARVVVGVFIILLGLAFTLDNFGVPLGGLLRGVLLKGWPVVFVVAGIGRLLEPGDGCRTPGGYIWIAVGLALLGDNFGLFEIGRVWPLGLVLIGVMLVWRAYVPPGHARAPRVEPRAAGDAGDTTQRLELLVILGGTRRTCSARDFRGGSLLAIMGGADVDLYEADIASGEAVLEVFTWWGGIEIRVPRHWEVVNRGLPILGGFIDSTTAPESREAPRPRLIVTGLAVMGGVEIKN